VTNPFQQPADVSFWEEVECVRAYVKDVSLAYVFYQLPWTRYSCLTIVSPTRAEGTGGIPLHQTSLSHTHTYTQITGKSLFPRRHGSCLEARCCSK